MNKMEKEFSKLVGKPCLAIGFDVGYSVDLVDGDAIDKDTVTIGDKSHKIDDQVKIGGNKYLVRIKDLTNRALSGYCFYYSQDLQAINDYISLADDDFVIIKKPQGKMIMLACHPTNPTVHAYHDNNLWWDEFNSQLKPVT